MAATITVRDGKYGPYVNHGKVNATLPKGKDPASVTLGRGGGDDRREGSQGRQRQEAVPRQGAAGKRPEPPWREASPGKAAGEQGRRQRAAASKADFRPSREEILQFIAENPDRSGKRDIAKAFSLKGENRIWLKDLLRDLHDEGLLQKDRKRLIRPGALPHVVVLDVFGRDAEGGLLAKPSEYAGDEPAPTVSIRVSRGGGGLAPGVGDRLLAKVFPTNEVFRACLYRPRRQDLREAPGCRARRVPRASRTARSGSSRSSAGSPS